MYETSGRLDSRKSCPFGRPASCVFVERSFSHHQSGQYACANEMRKVAVVERPRSHTERFQHESASATSVALAQKTPGAIHVEIAPSQPAKPFVFRMRVEKLRQHPLVVIGHSSRGAAHLSVMRPVPPTWTSNLKAPE